MGRVSLTEFGQEQRFYLEQFRGQLLVFAVPVADVAHVHQLAQSLVEHGANVVLAELTPGAERSGLHDEHVIELWRALETSRHEVVPIAPGRESVGGVPVDRSFTVAGHIARRLKADKLVLLTADEPATGAGGTASDESYRTLDVDGLHTGMLAIAADALRDGVSSVNVVEVAHVADELLTYRGAGTLYTGDDYVTIGRVGFGDFAQVQRLIEAGVADGFLKPRTDAAIRQLVVNGYGARVERDHIAGFAALLTEPYITDEIGEITALSTISRFAGGGVGTKLVEHLVAVAFEQDLRAVFATTTSPAAVEFFRHVGFTVADDDAIPAAKWNDYDPTRRAQVTSLIATLR